MAAFTSKSEGPPKNARGGFGQVILREFILCREDDIGHIAASARFAADPFAKIVRDNEMESRPGCHRVRSRAVWRENAIEDLDEIQDVNFEAGFFAEFTGHALLEGFPQFESSARNGPLAEQGLAAAANEESAPIFDDHTADTDDGTLGIFA